MSSKEILAQQVKALQVEKQTDLQLYTEQILKTPLQERKLQGTTWYPINLLETDFVFDKIRIQVERTQLVNEPHQFQTGMPVSLFSNQENAQKDRIQGTIQKIRQNTMTIVLPVDELPDWFDDGKLGVDILFDETTYTEMEKTLQNLISTENTRLAELREIFLGDKQAHFIQKKSFYQNPHLNFSQIEALEKTINAQDVAIIHGPPGTGKTTTLAEIIAFTLKTEKQVLVCTASNLALDWIVEKLVQKNIQVVRIGNPIRVSENVVNNTLDHKVISHSQYKQIKTLRKQADEYWSLSKKYKRNFGANEREQRKLLIQEAKSTSQEAEKLEDFITSSILDNAQVIACTLIGANHHYVFKKKYQTVFIDEASQALDPAIWIPISKAQRVILAGDHCQLPPTVKSYEAEKMGLGETLLERLIHKQPDAAVMLKVQYRMHEHIMGFSNEQFYHNDLIAHDSVKEIVLSEQERPFVFIDTAGCGFEEKQGENLSLSNPEEANLLIKILDDFRSRFSVSIAVISPYKAQVNYLKSLLENQENIRVGTVDSFQGQESEAVFISLVRSNDKNEIGFLADTRRLNVALTRAKKKLVVIGDSATLGNHPFYKKFLAYVEKLDAYQSAWEYLY